MNMDARKVDFLEQFTGITWAQRGVASLVGEDASLGLKKAWAGIEQMMLNRLLIQGPLQDIFAKARYDFATDSIKLNDSLETLLGRAKTYAVQAGPAAGEFWKLFGGGAGDDAGDAGNIPKFPIGIVRPINHPSIPARNHDHWRLAA